MAERTKALLDKLVQRRVEGRPDMKVLGFAFASKLKQLQTHMSNPGPDEPDTGRGSLGEVERPAF